MKYLSLRRPWGPVVNYDCSFQLQLQHSLNPLRFKQTNLNKPLPLNLKLIENIQHYEPPVFATYYKVIESYATILLSFIFHNFLAAALVQDYSHYILAPDSRTLHPVSIFQVNGPIANSASLVGGSNGNAQFTGPSSITFDYGKNIAGVVSVSVGASSPPNATLSLTYTESSLWISNQSCDATAGPQLDQPLVLPVGQGPGTYTVERWHNRGGFRYLTLTSNNAAIEVTSISTNFTAAPQQNLRDYKGYFHSNDEQLNRIWYAGEYPR
jgi:hypothetical protein